MAGKVEAPEKKKHCGIVMPISECDGCGPNHWADVLSIVRSAAELSGFSARLVSDTMESNLIHKEILANIYNDEIVVVDVSGRNPNVFFELGIRMATQKPTVIIKDNITQYPFDTAPNRFIEYPRDLRHPAMEVFKISLQQTLERTVDHGPEKSFIGQLGPFNIPKIEEKEVSINDAILEKLDSLEKRLRNTQPQSKELLDEEASIFIRRFPKMKMISNLPTVARIALLDYSEDVVKEGISRFVRSGNDDISIGVIKSGQRSHIIEVSDLPLRRKMEKLFDLAQEIDNLIPF